MPRHVAVTMDGNLRWAMRRGLQTSAWHEAGVGTLRKVVECCCKWGLRSSPSSPSPPKIGFGGRYSTAYIWGCLGASKVFAGSSKKSRGDDKGQWTTRCHCCS